MVTPINIVFSRVFLYGVVFQPLILRGLPVPKRVIVMHERVESEDYMRQARIQGGGHWIRRPPLGRRDPRLRRGFPRLKGRKKRHWCPLNGYSTPFKHNMAINILKSCKSVFEYVKNPSSTSHMRSSIPWRPPLVEILDMRL